MSVLNIIGAGENVAHDFCGLKIRTPKNWQDRSSMVLVAPAQEGSFAANLTIAQRAANKTLAQFIDEARESLQEQNLLGLTISENKSYRIDGVKALGFVFSHDEPGDGGSVRHVTRQHLVAIKKDKAYQATYSDLSSAFDTNRAGIEAILKSLRFPG